VNPLVSVVVVSYNTKDLTIKGLRTLRAVTTLPVEVIVVDNASQDGSADAVHAALPDVTVLRLLTNVGFGNAVNVGANHASGQYVLLINPDTEPVGDVVGALVSYAQRNPRNRVYTGRTLRADGTDDGMSAHALPSLWGYVCFATALSSVVKGSRLTNPDALPGFDRTAGGEVPAVSGCLLLVDRPLWTELGGFTPDYFMYSEDIDLSARARALGARPVVVPDAKLLHVGGAASSSINKRVMVLRGKTTYVRLRWSRPTAAFARLLIATGVLVRAAGSGSWRQVWAQRKTWLPGWPAPVPASERVSA
jgi:N-acetylglucosaminyl-diphospho-decaprenol L-rhamnosyltransferase